LSAVEKAIVAYGKDRWNLVMASDKLKSKADLEKVLNSFDVEHLKGCVKAVNALSTSVPISNGTFGRLQLQFNQAKDSPPSPRPERIGKE